MHQALLSFYLTLFSLLDPLLFSSCYVHLLKLVKSYFRMKWPNKLINYINWTMRHKKKKKTHLGFFWHLPGYFWHPPGYIKRMEQRRRGENQWARQGGLGPEFSHPSCWTGIFLSLVTMALWTWVAVATQESLPFVHNRWLLGLLVFTRLLCPPASLCWGIWRIGDLNNNKADEG